MRRLRTASTRRPLAIVALVCALALTAGIAQGAIAGAGPVPSPKALARAILDAFKAPEPDGVTARIRFTNRLLGSGALAGGGASPLVSGGEGRLWIQRGGDLRLELQSDAGDAQIVAVGDTLTLYDATSNTVYRAKLPEHAADAAKPSRRPGAKLTLAKIQTALDRLARRWTISGAQPTTTAGQPTYTVRIAPKDRGGLLGAAELAWDAVRGAPLRVAVHARGASQPVLELEATDVSYDAVPDAAVRAAPPAGAKVVDVGPDASERPASPSRAAGRPKPAAVTGLAAVRGALGFDIAAPAELAGLARTAVRLVKVDGKPAALTIYGEGLGAIAVLQHATRPAAGRAREAAPAPRRRHRGRGELRLPGVDVGGAPGSVLATALGTVVSFDRGGVTHAVAGSVPAELAERAARDLR